MKRAPGYIAMLAFLSLANCVAFTTVSPQPQPAVMVAPPPAPPMTVRPMAVRRKPVALRQKWVDRYLATRAEILAKSEAEPRGFGAYNYLLYTGVTDNTTLDGKRYEAALSAYLQIAFQNAYCESEQNIPERAMNLNEINLSLLPIKISRTQAESIMQAHCENPILEWPLNRMPYDTERAQVLIMRANKESIKLRLSGEGPFLVASLQPLSRFDSQREDELIVWDLRIVDITLIPLAVKEFLKAVESPTGNNTWSVESFRRIAFEIRNGLEIVRNAGEITSEAEAAVLSYLKSKN